MPTPHTLLMMVGLPRSGKSTLIRGFKKQHPVVNIDAIRLALHGQAYASQAEPFVWAIARTMVKALFLAGHEHVVLDACNNTRARRDEWRSRGWNRTYVTLETPASVCIERARADDREDLVAIIDRMAAAHEPVDDDEIDDRIAA